VSSNFMTKTTPAQEKLVNDSLSMDNDIGAAYERMKANLRDSLGLPAPNNYVDDADSRVVMPAAAAVQSGPVPNPEARCIRVIYPRGNSRFELYGVDESDLDQQEQKIRALYQ
jgi:hypothetical protein